MRYFAGLAVSVEETHVCVIDRDGKVILEARTPTAPPPLKASNMVLSLLKDMVLHDLPWEFGSARTDRRSN